MELIKKYSKSIILILVITIINLVIIAYKLPSSGHATFSKYSILIYTIFLIITCLFAAIFYFSERKKWKIEKVFLVCGLILGSFYSLVIPIGGTPDEPAHFWRAYQLSEGRIFTETDTDGNIGSPIPDNLRFVISNKYSVLENGYSLTKEEFFTKASEDYKTEPLPAGNYAPFNYIPQTIGIWIGKILHLPLIPMMYLSRLFNMIFCIIIVYFCLKYIPIMKKTVFLIAMFPMTMHLFSSVSADGSIICASIALIAYVLYARNTMQRQFNYKDFLLLIFICASLSITKPMYALLCPILFWIPHQRFKSNTQKIITIISLGAITLALLLIRIIPTYPLEMRADTDPTYQIHFILSQPINFIFILFKNAILLPEQVIDGAFGKSLEWFSVELFYPCILTFLLFFAFLCAEPETKITRNFRIFVFISFFAIVFSTYAAMFVQWTPPGATIIEGIQGRYFLPIVLLIPIFCLPSKKLDKRNIVPLNYLFIFSVLTNLYAITMVFCSHI